MKAFQRICKNKLCKRSFATNYPTKRYCTVVCSQRQRQREYLKRKAVAHAS
jgi:hypothetical protein